MINHALFVRREPEPGKEKEVADFLRSGLAIVQEESATTAWFAIKLTPSTFGIFDAFPNEAGRQAHLSGCGLDGQSVRTAGAASVHRENRCAGLQAAGIGYR